MFDHVRYAFTSGKFVGSTWAAGGNYQNPSNFGYLYFVKNEKLSPDAVAKILESAAPAPWMLPLPASWSIWPSGLRRMSWVPSPTEVLPMAGGVGVASTPIR